MLAFQPMLVVPLLEYRVGSRSRTLKRSSPGMLDTQRISCFPENLCRLLMSVRIQRTLCFQTQVALSYTTHARSNLCRRRRSWYSLRPTPVGSFPMLTTFPVSSRISGPVQECAVVSYGKNASSPHESRVCIPFVMFETLANQSNLKALDPRVYMSESSARVATACAHSRLHTSARTGTHAQIFHTCISSSHSRHSLLGIFPDNVLKTIACESPAQAEYILSVLP